MAIVYYLRSMDLVKQAALRTSKMDHRYFGLIMIHLCTTLIPKKPFFVVLINAIGPRRRLKNDRLAEKYTRLKLSSRKIL